MKVVIKNAWGSADPTQVAFPFHHVNAFVEAANPVIFVGLVEWADKVLTE